MSFLTSNVNLSDLTTFEIGGPTLWLATPHNLEELKEALKFAQSENLPFYPLGSGSNILASDHGFQGVVIQPLMQECLFKNDLSGTVSVQAQAGLIWDDLVKETVERDLAGLECLSAIPGRVGASPVQNIGAYGQEVASLIESVEVLDCQTLEVANIPANECQFRYRSSRFKHEWRGKYIIVSVTFKLHPHGAPNMRYQDLQRFFSKELTQDPQWQPNLQEVRQAVISVRRSKSMTYDKANPNHRCAGSFYLNPMIDRDKAEVLQKEYPHMPVYPADTPDKLKLSAAWLLDNAGISKGFHLGEAGVSSDHVLCFINVGKARAEDILALSDFAVAKVEKKFAIKLIPEPNMLGF